MNNARCVVAVFMLCIAPGVFGMGNYPAGARSLALSHASVSLSDVWSSFHNQAGLSTISRISAGFYYESRYNLEELCLAAGTVAIPAAGGVAGLSFLQFGKTIFKEQKLGLAWSKQLAKYLNAGIQFDYFWQTLPEVEKPYGSATAEIGVLWYPNQYLALGGHVFNPVHQGFKTLTGMNRMPVVLRVGGHYELKNTALIAVEVKNETNLPAVIKTGIEFSLAEGFALRFGASGKPFRYTAGAGYKSKELTADIGFGYQSILGITPSVSIQFSW